MELPVARSSSFGVWLGMSGVGFIWLGNEWGWLYVYLAGNEWGWLYLVVVEMGWLSLMIHVTICCLPDVF